MIIDELKIKGAQTRMLLYLKKLFIFLVILNFSAESKADLQSLRRQAQSGNSSSTPSFEFFRGSLIRCTKLRDGDDHSILYFPDSDRYNFFTRMYSWRKDCTLEQEFFEQLKIEEACFSKRLEELTQEAQVIAGEFREELRSDFSVYQYYETTRIRFLISDQRPNLMQSAFNEIKNALTNSKQSAFCPLDFSIHIEIRFSNRSGSEVFEKIVDVPTF